MEDPGWLTGFGRRGGTTIGNVCARTGRCVPRFVLLAAVACSLTGCSLFVMAGKMFFGDPLIPSSFRSATDINLAKEQKRVLFLCSTPMSIKRDMPSLEIDLVEGITRRLKLSGIEVVDPDAVATRIDDNGGAWDDPRDFAEGLGADYIMHIDLDEFGFQEENSPSMLRGRANGSITVYEVTEEKGITRAEEIYVSEYTSVYPSHHPESADRMSSKAFRKRYVDKVCRQLALVFCDHRFSDAMD
jgi:hypothetical protein